jgi:hypothetical protein
MIVYCANFGTIWFHKTYESGSAAWFNTTGIRRSRSSSKIRRRWTFQGSIRFNANQFPWVRTPSDLIGKRYFCHEVETIGDEMRLLCAAPVNKDHRIDAFLVCVRSEDVGFIIRRLEWKSKSVRLISSSGGKSGPQEMLLLVHPGSWILTNQGYWKWEIRLNRSGRPRVELTPVDAENEHLIR